MLLIAADSTNTENNMDIISNVSIESQPIITKSYSKALTSNLRKPKSNTITDWCNTVSKILASKCTEEFDLHTWNNNNLTEAFDDKDNLFKFFTHKIQTLPTNHNIPYAINQKFNYLDTAFF